MKKSILITVVTMAMVTCSQAIQMNWSDSATAYGKNSVALNSTLVYLVSAPHLTAAPTWDNTTHAVAGGYTLINAGILNANGTFTTMSQVPGGSAQWDAGGILTLANQSKLPPGYPTSVTGAILSGTNNKKDYYMVFFDASTYGAAQNYEVVGAAANGVGNSPTGATSTPFAVAFSASATAGNWQSIPEPTSLALLGIGLAAIGLRRRFMKK